MIRSGNLRALAAAAILFAGGFLAADRMAAARAAAPADAQETRTSFAGTAGVMSVDGKEYIIIVRDKKLWRIAAGKGGDNNSIVPWAILAD